MKHAGDSSNSKTAGFDPVNVSAILTSPFMSTFRIPTTDIYPPFLAKVIQLLSNCEARGAIYFVTCGYRTPEESDKLYQQGRTTPGKVISNAKAFQSYHNFGLAIDVCRDLDDNKTNGLQMDWSEADYSILIEEGQKLGLELGGLFKSIKDLPHVQWPLPSNVTLIDLKTAHLKGGLKTAWVLLGP